MSVMQSWAVIGPSLSRPLRLLNFWSWPVVVRAVAVTIRLAVVVAQAVSCMVLPFQLHPAQTTQSLWAVAGQA